jgi:hypothetical protein
MTEKEKNKIKNAYRKIGIDPDAALVNEKNISQKLDSGEYRIKDYLK